MFVNPPVVNRELGHPALVSRRDAPRRARVPKRNLQIDRLRAEPLATEVLTTYLKERFEKPPGAPDVIRGYRGGYLPLRRREIERGLREGEVRGVVSTNALELGIDIGALDVAVLAGYPGTIAATWQRRGARAAAPAGRRRCWWRQRAARSVHRPQPVVLLRCVARARAHQPGQPAHPRRPREVRGVRAAVCRRRGAVRTRGPGGGPRASWRRRASCIRATAVALDERELPGRRGQPAHRLLRQLRRRRSATGGDG